MKHNSYSTAGFIKKTAQKLKSKYLKTKPRPVFPGIDLPYAN